MHLAGLKHRKIEGGIVVEGLEKGVECPTVLYIPEGVTDIDWHAFKGEDLEVLVLPSTLESIGYMAFFECHYLREIRFAKECKLRVIEESAFEGTAIEELILPRKLKSIEESAFSGCESLIEVSFELGSELELIGDFAFEYCSSLSRIGLPNGLYSIGHGAFSYCESLDAMYIPKSVKIMHYTILQILSA